MATQREAPGHHSNNKASKALRETFDPIFAQIRLHFIAPERFKEGLDLGGKRMVGL
jgi:hypothetical protein